MSGKILLLCGGVGGAKLALGFARLLAPDELTVVVNTGDDFDHLGLRICPDLDTVLYTLAGVNNAETGWGRAEETWNCLTALEAIGGETWFKLGDRDIALHLRRLGLLRAGATLSAATHELCAAFGTPPNIAPMSDDPVATIVETDAGALAFQDYFVRRRCAPVVRGYRFAGIEAARPSPAFAAALADPALRGIVICPSNPFVSIGPILAVPGVTEALRARQYPVVAVSPIIAGRALKGPADKMFREFGYAGTAADVARLYDGLIDGFLIDERDARLAGTIGGAVACRSAQTVMTTLDDRIALARIAAAFLDALRGRPARGPH